MSHNDTAKMQKLLSKILHYFSEDYVLDPVHSYWKEMLLTNDGWVTAQQLATFPDVMIEADEGASTVLDVASQSGGQLLVDTNRRCVKRAIPIDLAQDPLRRTICVRPIHANATDEEIKAFFLPYGPVKRVERQTFTDFESQKSRKRPWAFVQFEDEDALERCLIDKPTFGTLSNFGQHFIPKLSVSRRKDFETLMTIEANEHYEWNKREHLLQKKSVAHADIGNKKVTTQPLADTTTETDVPPTHVKRVPEGSILILPDLPSGVSWRELKSTLGAIAKGVCSIVYILTDSEMNNVTYIFMKNSIGSQRVLDRYHVEAAENETLRTQIPQMSIATLAQEARAKQLYEGGGGSQQIERKRKENIEWRKKQEGEKKVKKTYSPSFQ